MVKVMQFAVSQGKVAVHCHAGRGEYIPYHSFKKKWTHYIYSLKFSKMAVSFLVRFLFFGVQICFSPILPNRYFNDKACNSYSMVCPPLFCGDNCTGGQLW